MRSWGRTFQAVVKKEWRESIRDRRSMTAGALFAVSGPVLVALMIANTVQTERSDEPIRARTHGLEHAPDLAEFLEQEGVLSVASGGELQEPAVALRIPADYRERFAAGSSVRVQVEADRSKPAARLEAERLERLVRGYSASLGQLRLSLRGVAPSVAAPVRVESRDLATREARSSQTLSVLTIYFLMAAFVGSTAVAIDAAAGERERNSLEVLMAQPVSGLAVFAGKTAVAAAFGALGVALTLAVAQLAFQHVPLAEIGLTWTLDWLGAGQMLLMLLPLVILVAASQVALALVAKTFKEASASLNLFLFLPVVVALVVQMKELEAPWMYAVPLLGHQQILTGSFRAELPDFLQLAAVSAISLALAALLIWVGGRMLGRERIVFGQTD
ncbi:MAG: ABC transporter permease subunit [Acidobacteriota bacterium]